MTAPFTARNVAKMVLKTVVATKTAEITADAMVDYTSLEEDSITVNIGSKVIGWYISSKLEPVTDAVVDKSADFITEQRAKRAAKKTSEEK